MDTLFIFLLCFYFGSAKIKINDLIVPQSVEFGSVNELTLDCNYDVDDDTGIELKWFLNHNQIYQWIPETNYPPQAMGSIKDHIDPNFKVSDDRNTMFRALHLTNVSPDLSGNYSCKVSGYYSEAEVTKTMIIYDPADSEPTLEIIDGGVDRESAVICQASGIFPKPDMTLYIANNNESIIFRDDDETFEFDDDSGLYNVSSFLLFDSSNLTSDAFYACELKIPGSTYEERKIQFHDPKTEDGDVEAQFEEDYLNFLNTDNTTETTVNQTQDYAEFETQIEEDRMSLLNFTQTSDIVITKYGDDKDDDSVTVELEVGSSFTHLPSVRLLSTTLLLLMLNLTS